VPLVLFVPDSEVVYRDQAGAELTANAHRFVSRLAACRYLGYLTAQKAAMTRQAGAHTNRPELVAVHGYDTKYAMHALRLGLQGIELLTTGRITLPALDPPRRAAPGRGPGRRLRRRGPAGPVAGQPRHRRSRPPPRRDQRRRGRQISTDRAACYWPPDAARLPLVASVYPT
jgi:hypothetical protein